MCWKARGVVEQRKRFIEEYEAGDLSLAELCRGYEISRPTGYKWIGRYLAEGPGGLKDRSRAPQHHPQALSAGMKELILALKAKHLSWGAPKLVAYLAARSPQQKFPAVSTVGELLKRQGLTVSRKRRPRAAEPRHPLEHADAANRVWSVDFKGWFRTGDGVRCDPLTLSDNYSRYLLRCQAVPGEMTVYVKPVMAAAFREFGLPERIRCDNGAPFASNGASGLSALAVWWIRLGIVPERIEPGSPQQNGRHERMHLTLQQETASPPAPSIRQQQKRFDRFREEYNTERPHEALGQRPPAEFYQCSGREYPSRLPVPEYPQHWRVKRVHSGGKFVFAGKRPFASHVLENEYIGLEAVADGYWRVWFGNYELGVLDERTGKILPPSAWAASHPERSSGSADTEQEQA